MHENGHDENQENEANQNDLNVIVQEDNDEMNNAMIVEDSVDKLIPRNSNSFDLPKIAKWPWSLFGDKRPDFDMPYCIDNFNFCYVYIFCDE